MSTRRLHHAAHATRGFSLVEATISLVIVAVMMATAVSIAGHAARARRIQSDVSLGTRLAAGLMGEVLANRYSNSDRDTGFGLEAGETLTDRRTLNDVDDYDGLDETLVVEPEGKPIGEAAGWRRKVTVVRVTPVDVTTPLASLAADSGLKRVTVQAVSPRGTVTTMTALVARSGLSAPGALPPTGVVAGAVVRLESADAPVIVSVDALNAPAAP